MIGVESDISEASAQEGRMGAEKGPVIIGDQSDYLPSAEMLRMGTSETEMDSVAAIFVPDSMKKDRGTAWEIERDWVQVKETHAKTAGMRQRDVDSLARQEWDVTKKQTHGKAFELRERDEKASASHASQEWEIKHVQSKVRCGREREKLFERVSKSQEFDRSIELQQSAQNQKDLEEQLARLGMDVSFDLDLAPIYIPLGRNSENGRPMQVNS